VPYRVPFFGGDVPHDKPPTLLHFPAQFENASVPDSVQACSGNGNSGARHGRAGAVGILPSRPINRQPDARTMETRMVFLLQRDQSRRVLFLLRQDAAIGLKLGLPPSPHHRHAAEGQQYERGGLRNGCQQEGARLPSSVGAIADDLPEIIDGVGGLECPAATGRQQ
jgi:hypothetical protein